VTGNQILGPRLHRENQVSFNKSRLQKTPIFEKKPRFGEIPKKVLQKIPQNSFTIATANQSGQRGSCPIHKNHLTQKQKIV